jgi:hypothetical protein
MRASNVQGVLKVHVSRPAATRLVKSNMVLTQGYLLIKVLLPLSCPCCLGRNHIENTLRPSWEHIHKLVGRATVFQSFTIVAAGHFKFSIFTILSLLDHNITASSMSYAHIPEYMLLSYFSNTMSLERQKLTSTIDRLVNTSNINIISKSIVLLQIILFYLLY